MIVNYGSHRYKTLAWAELQYIEAIEAAASPIFKNKFIYSTVPVRNIIYCTSKLYIISIFK